MGRRFLLIMIVLALGTGDLLLLKRHWHHRANFASVTHVGLDSLFVMVPTSTQAAALHNGRWSPDLAKAAIPSEGEALHKRSITLITLEPHPTYGKFLQAIRSLRAQQKCNVLIREGNVLVEGHTKPDQLEIPALVLCGSAIGDAGFSGTLPPDGVVRL
ncbi:MAG TPA: hypothetical protein VM657_08990 [Sphingomonas sp.]|nr:hypothetical protein [Sphingomonas sp.]